jgi:hypothetical protein
MSDLFYFSLLWVFAAVFFLPLVIDDMAKTRNQKRKANHFKKGAE